MRFSRPARSICALSSGSHQTWKVSTAMPTVEASNGAARSSACPRVEIRARSAAYLGCSFWTARDYILQGLIPIVNLPPLRHREGDRARKALRRVLVDRQDLDAFIDARKRREVGSTG